MEMRVLDLGGDHIIRTPLYTGTSSPQALQYVVKTSKLNTAPCKPYLLDRVEKKLRNCSLEGGENASQIMFYVEFQNYMVKKFFTLGCLTAAEGNCYVIINGRKPVDVYYCPKTYPNGYFNASVLGLATPKKVLQPEERIELPFYQTWFMVATDICSFTIWNEPFRPPDQRPPEDQPPDRPPDQSPEQSPELPPDRPPEHQPTVRPPERPSERSTEPSPLDQSTDRSTEQSPAEHPPPGQPASDRRTDRGEDRLQYALQRWPESQLALPWSESTEPPPEASPAQPTTSSVPSGYPSPSSFDEMIFTPRTLAVIDELL